MTGSKASFGFEYKDRRLINNRQQNGRRRGRGGNNPGGGNAPRQGGGGQGRSDNGNRIDSRARGNASQLYEKYKNLASDSQRQGDRVNTEYYLQFADHYFRVLADQRGRVEENQPRRQQRDEFDGDNDDFYGDEGEPVRAGEQQQPQQQQPSQQYQNDDGQGDRQGNYRRERPERADRNDRQDRGGNGGDRQSTGQDRNGNAQDRGGQERAGQERAGQDRGGQDRGGNVSGDRGENEQSRPPRNWEPRVEREGRPDREARPDRDQQPRRARPDREQQTGTPPRREPEQPQQLDAFASTEQAAPEQAAAEQAEAPRRRGRPRREPVAETAAQPEANGNGFEADRLPPSLGISAAANDADGEAPKPRRRRAAPRATDVPTAAE